MKSNTPPKFWHQTTALSVCEFVENFAPEFGYHVALTGGCLYKDGPRKDLDLVFYRVRQVKTPDSLGLLRRLQEEGFSGIYGNGWVFKAKLDDKKVDLMFPEEIGAFLEFETFAQYNARLKSQEPASEYFE